MNKLILIIVICFLGTGLFAQTYPTPPQSLGSVNILVRDTGGLAVRQTFIMPVYSDTSAANTMGYPKNYIGSQIFTSSDNNLWIRNTTRTGWIKISSSASVSPTWQQTLINGSTLLQNNLVAGAKKQFEWDNMGNYSITSPKTSGGESHYYQDSVQAEINNRDATVRVALDSIQLLADSVYMPSISQGGSNDSVMVINPSTGLVSYVNKNSIGFSTTLQGAIDNSPDLDKDNTINYNGYSYKDSGFLVKSFEGDTVRVKTENGIYLWDGASGDYTNIDVTDNTFNIGFPIGTSLKMDFSVTGSNQNNLGFQDTTATQAWVFPKVIGGNGNLALSVNGEYADLYGRITLPTFDSTTLYNKISNWGIDSVLAVNQLLTTDRIINTTNGTLRIQDNGGAGARFEANGYVRFNSGAFDFLELDPDGNIASYSNLGIKFASGGQGAINVNSTNAADDALIDRFSIQSNSDKAEIKFPNTSNFIIDNPDHDQKVGIGTTTPTVALDVVGDVAFKSTGLLSSNVIDDEVGLYNSGNLISAYSLGSDHYWYGNANLVIDQVTGNVGVGTTVGVDPTEKLEVVGNVKATGTIETGGYTVGTLPSGVIGQFSYVTDALAPSYGVTVVGGGAVTIPVFFNGSTWIAH